MNTIVALGIIFFFLRHLHAGYWEATFAGNAAGMVCSFLLNRSFTFHSRVSLKRGLLLFAAVSLLCYLFSYSASKMIVKTPPFSFSYQNDAAVLIGMAFYTLSNYLGQKYIVFNGRIR